VRSSQRTRNTKLNRFDLRSRHLQSLENPEEHGHVLSWHDFVGLWLNIVLDLVKSRTIGTAQPPKPRDADIPEAWLTTKDDFGVGGHQVFTLDQSDLEQNPRSHPSVGHESRRLVLELGCFWTRRTIEFTGTIQCC